jgi:hypothetical protein
MQSLEIKIIFYARVFFPEFIDLVHAYCFEIEQQKDPIKNISGYQVDSTGNIYKDYYHSIKIKLPIASKTIR